MKHRVIVAAVLASVAAAPVLAQAGSQPSAAGGPTSGRGGGGAMLRAADANGDGVVTRAEYMVAVDARFDRMDANHDGVLTADEMPTREGRRRAERGGQDSGRGGADTPPPPPPNELSSNATGTPPAPAQAGPRPDASARNRSPETRDQYRAAAMRRFDRLDTNGDGRIDQTEMAAMGPRGGGRDAGRPADQ